MVQPLRRLMCRVRKRMLVQGLQLQLFCVCFLPRKLPSRERGRNTYLTRLYKNKYYNTRTGLGVFLLLILFL